ncbi:MAG: hypothetical protein Q8Q08_01355 [Candidatus Omnitrophota bacterium]|nr:hypothetical protein [Candidatus Omnitrophota bacterium]MDZ4241606.1 hypothetical protein [Candidatus Omnitrophota bacterium]
MSEALPTDHARGRPMASKLIPVLLIAFLAGIFVFLKFYGPVWIEQQYRLGHTDLLNRLLGEIQPQKLEFYLGRGEEVLWGPASQAASGMAFLLFVWIFLRDAGFWRFFAAVWLFLIATKWDVLGFPPYGDAVGGPFAEAIWLKQNGFNYAGLFQQPGYAQGGAKVYMFSIYPTFLAVLMSGIPSVKVFLAVGHGLVFAMAAGIVALSRELLRKVFDRETAALAPLILLGHPLFQAQAEAINMEMPCLLFVMLATHALSLRRFSWAAAMAVIAVFVKGTAVFACAALVVIYGTLFVFVRPHRFRPALFIWAVVLMGMAGFNVWLKYLLKDQHVSFGMLTPLIGWVSLNKTSPVFLYSFSALVFCVYAAVKLARTPGNSGERSRVFMGELFVPSAFFVLAGMWFMLFLNFFAVSPRYWLLLSPFYGFCLIYVLRLVVRPRKVVLAGLIVAVGISFYSAYGAFYHSMLENDHVLLEKCLEYRSDLRVNQMLARRMEEKYQALKIGAPFITAQILGMPELGYVQKKLRVVIYGFNCYYGGIENYSGLANMDGGRAVFVGLKFPQPNVGFSFPIHEQDVILEELQYGNKKAWIFAGGRSIEAMYWFNKALRMKSLSEQNLPKPERAP